MNALQRASGGLITRFITLESSLRRACLTTLPSLTEPSSTSISSPSSPPTQLATVPPPPPHTPNSYTFHTIHHHPAILNSIHAPTYHHILTHLDKIITKSTPPLPPPRISLTTFLGLPQPADPSLLLEQEEDALDLHKYYQSSSIEGKKLLNMKMQMMMGGMTEMWADSVKRKRRKKMNKHKHRKRLKDRRNQKRYN